MNAATGELCADDVMARTFVAVAPEDTLGEMAEKMAGVDAGSVLVVEFGCLTGILTSRDVMCAIGERVHPSEARVRDWMTAEPVTARPDTSTDEAARLMVAGGFHHLPMVEDQRPIGVVGLRATLGTLQHGSGW